MTAVAASTCMPWISGLPHAAWCHLVGPVPACASLLGPLPLFPRVFSCTECDSCGSFYMHAMHKQLTSSSICQLAPSLEGLVLACASLLGPLPLASSPAPCMTVVAAAYLVQHAPACARLVLPSSSRPSLRLPLEASAARVVSCTMHDSCGSGLPRAACTRLCPPGTT